VLCTQCVTILALSDHQDEKLILYYPLHRTKIILLKLNIFLSYLQEDMDSHFYQL
jgi:hypothetical protein